MGSQTLPQKTCLDAKATGLPSRRNLSLRRPLHYPLPPRRTSQRFTKSILLYSFFVKGTLRRLLGVEATAKFASLSLLPSPPPPISAQSVKLTLKLYLFLPVVLSSASYNRFMCVRRIGDFFFVSFDGACSRLAGFAAIPAIGRRAGRPLQRHVHQRRSVGGGQAPRPAGAIPPREAGP